MTSKQIKRIIGDHQSKEVVSYKRYQRYYEGNNTTIQDAPIEADPDNRHSMAYIRKGINTTTGFMGKPGNIVLDYPPSKNNKTIAMIMSEKGQLKETHCLTIALTKGLAYKLVWKEKTEIKYAVVNPDNVIIVWDDKIEPEKVAAYYYTEKSWINEEGEEDKKVTFWNYNLETFEKWESINDEDFILNEDPKISINNPTTPKIVNIAEHQVNPEKRNIFYHVIDLVDFQDKTVSKNMANEIQTIANSMLVMSDILDDTMPDELTGETDRAKFLKAKIKIRDGISKSQGDFVEWVTKVVQWEGVFGIYDKVDQKIFDFMEIPDLSNDKFYAELSGVAMAYRLLAFENKASMIEAYYRQGIMQTIEIINAFPGSDKVDLEKLNITFKRNLPLDVKARLEESMMIMSMADREAALNYFETGNIKPVKDILKRLAENTDNQEITDILNARVSDEPQADNDE